MKEILTWGVDVPAQFERLGINAALAYEGGGLVPSVYELSEDDYAILDADPEENWTGKDAGWRYAKGANISPDTFVIVNGHEMEGFSDMHDEDGEEDEEMRSYDTLLDHLEETRGATNGKNVAALTAELASYNDMTLGELFTKYQPKEEE